MDKYLVNTERKERIMEYWNERAVQQLDTSATTNDVYLRELEISTIIQTLHEIRMSENKNILDVGCADGYFMLKAADAFPKSKFLGVDYSENMIKLANDRLNSSPELRNRVKFMVGDATDIKKTCGKLTFDVILSDRLLINLDSVGTQVNAITEIAECLKEGGFYIAIENFIEGHQSMNKARRHVGLPEIPLRWHNLFLIKEDFLKNVKHFFKIIAFTDFASSYYFATRVVYAKMCQMRGEEPDYKHDIHKLSVKLPWIGEFSPLKMIVLCKK